MKGVDDIRITNVSGFDEADGSWWETYEVEIVTGGVSTCYYLDYADLVELGNLITLIRNE